MGPVIRRLAPSQGSNGGGAHAAQGAEIHWVGAGRTAPEVVAGVPSVHMVWNGGYPLCLDGRSLRLDDEVFLVLNAGHVLAARSRRDPGASLLSVYFAPELLARAFADLKASQREQLGACGQGGSLCLLEHVRERDKSIASVMRYVAHHICAGVEDASWYEEQVSFLLGRLLVSEATTVHNISAMTHAKAWKRREIFLRLARVTDLIHSAYERPLTIAELAAAAHWSVFHMMREFKVVHGVSPHEYLQRRRTQAAARLLCSTDLSVAEIAERVGFHDRSTLMRRLQRMHGLNARSLRVLSQSPQPVQHRMPTAAAYGVNPATSIPSVR
jgi:AraC family transcriptional regulator